MPVVLMRVAKEVPIPNGVKVTIKSRKVSIEGPRGKLYRSFKHANVTLRVVQRGSSETEAPQGLPKVDENKELSVLVEKRMDKKKRCAVVKTIVGHLNNMILGVTKGFRYKMKLVYAHFPINATVKDGGDTIELRNYIGQKDTRRINLLKGTKVIEPGAKDEFWIEGNDIEDVSRSASKIWQSCRVHDKDIRKFLDGVYVYAKGVQGEEQPI